MPFTIEIDHSIKIVRNTYYGIIVKEDLSNVWHHLLTLKEFTELKYNLFSDYRKSNFDIIPKEEDRMLDFLVSIKHILDGKKEAAILNNPKDTALSVLMQMQAFEKVGYIVKLFSTEIAAINWLTDFTNE
ncbi:MAG: hypothetical protein JXA77_02865 [Bacteroidales bacterium]|nr:hypothetical protein [Bacteroidales bacterium]MBN2819925.1 hypothetical protein [Bacteroidales bacterium]